MTRFRDELRLLADQAPDAAGLADRAVRGARRWKARAYGSVAATLAALAAGAAFLVIPPGAETISGTVTDALPDHGVGAAAYAYYDFCGRKWDPRENTHTFTEDCSQWKLVTQDGESFRMPQALSVYTEQSAANYMNTGGPLAITPDGRHVAYYSQSDERFAVRDLQNGTISLTPPKISRDTLVRSDGRLQLSPDGLFLGIAGRGWPNTVVNLRTGESTDIPTGWYVQSVGSGGTPVVLGDGQGRLARLEDGRPKILLDNGDELRSDGTLSADGRVIYYLEGGKRGDGAGDTPHDTIVTLDVTTGEELSRARFRDVPKGFLPMSPGGWLDADEVLLTGMLTGGLDRRSRTDVPTQGEILYAINVRTGTIREQDTYTYRAWAGDLVLPGF